MTQPRKLARVVAPAWAMIDAVPPPSGFEFQQRADGTVVITHHGRPATTLRGSRAVEFLEDVGADPQEVMARWTGNYRRGNERLGPQHPRNRR